MKLLHVWILRHWRIGVLGMKSIHQTFCHCATPYLLQYSEINMQNSGSGSSGSTSGLIFHLARFDKF